MIVIDMYSIMQWIKFCLALYVLALYLIASVQMMIDREFKKGLVFGFIIPTMILCLSVVLGY